MYFNELKIGQKVTLSPVTIKKDEMLAFAKKYDNVPLHTDEEYAKTTRFGRLLAPGMMTFLKVWSKYLEKDLFGEELIAGTSTEVSWSAPVFADDTLYGTAEITALDSRSERNGTAELTIKALNQNNNEVLKALVRAIVKKT